MSLLKQPSAIITLLFLLIWIVVRYWPSTPSTAFEAPMDLTVGEAFVADFEVDKSETHTIGLKLNYAKAAELFPATVLLGRHEDYGCALPSPFQIGLFDGSNDISHLVRHETSTGGGFYEGGDYTRSLATAALSPGSTYRISITPPKDAALIQPADPRLVVLRNSAAVKGEIVMREIWLLFIAALGLFSLVWFVLSLLFRRIRNKQAS